jgi:hypothetical protein
MLEFQLEFEFGRLLRLAEAREDVRLAHGKDLRVFAEPERAALREKACSYCLHALRKHSDLQISDSEFSERERRGLEMLAMIGAPSGADASSRDAAEQASFPWFR